MIHQRNWGREGNLIKKIFAKFSNKFKDFEKIKDKIVYVLNGFTKDRINKLNGDL